MGLLSFKSLAGQPKDPNETFSLFSLVDLLEMMVLFLLSSTRGQEKKSLIKSLQCRCMEVEIFLQGTKLVLNNFLMCLIGLHLYLSGR